MELRSRDPHSVYAHVIGGEGNEQLASIMETPSQVEGFGIASGCPAMAGDARDGGNALTG